VTGFVFGCIGGIAGGTKLEIAQELVNWLHRVARRF
jgi:hypothetical protein